VTDPVQKLTQQTLSRLHALGEGNGVDRADITLVESTESIYTLLGRLTLTPHCEVKSRKSFGRIKGKAYKVFPSFAELQTEITSIQKDFQEGGDWTQEAVAELEKTAGHGWGLHSSLLTLTDKKTILGATENCQTCNGTAQHPCLECRGLGFATCHYCEGRGQELCPHCNGHRQDPVNPANKCPICHGTGYALCRFCQGTMRLQCVTCQGRGNTPCNACQGKGFISMEVLITKGARMDFALGPTTGLPSGLLRGLSRVGEDKLAKGHADITMKADINDDPKAPKQSDLAIYLDAKIPYADVKIKFGKKTSIIGCFGKQGRLSGVPAFLDESLAPARLKLASAAKTGSSLHAALATRAIKDAFELVVSGKNKVNDLRRLYPVGLSAEAAQEIMANLNLCFRNSTARTRLIVSGLCVLVSTALFGGMFMTPLFTHLTQMTGTMGAPLIKALMPLAALSASWFTLQQSAKSVLRRQYAGLKIAGRQSIGRTGYAALGTIAALYLALLFLSGNLI